MGQRLDRNSGNGRGKYGLIKNRRLRDCLLKANDGESGVEFAASVCKAIVVLERAGIIEWGEAESEHEFFVIKLKDKYADDALRRYVISAAHDDSDYAREVNELADRAGTSNPFCKAPD